MAWNQISTNNKQIIGEIKKITRINEDALSPYFSQIHVCTFSESKIKAVIDLIDTDYNLPPWICFPEIDANSSFWRQTMEYWHCRWVLDWQAKTTKEKVLLLKTHPATQGWIEKMQYLKMLEGVEVELDMIVKH